MMKQPSLKGQSHVNTNEIFGFSFFPALFRERERGRYGGNSKAQ